MCSSSKFLGEFKYITRDEKQLSDVWVFLRIPIKMKRNHFWRKKTHMRKTWRIFAGIVANRDPLLSRSAPRNICIGHQMHIFDPCIYTKNLCNAQHFEFNRSLSFQWFSWFQQFVERSIQFLFEIHVLKHFDSFCLFFVCCVSWTLLFSIHLHKYLCLDCPEYFQLWSGWIYLNL